MPAIKDIWIELPEPQLGLLRDYTRMMYNEAAGTIAFNKGYEGEVIESKKERQRNEYELAKRLHDMEQVKSRTRFTIRELSRWTKAVGNCPQCFFQGMKGGPDLAVDWLDDMEQVIREARARIAADERGEIIKVAA